MLWCFSDIWHCLLHMYYDLYWPLNNSCTVHDTNKILMQYTVYLLCKYNLIICHCLKFFLVDDTSIYHHACSTEEIYSVNSETLVLRCMETESDQWVNHDQISIGATSQMQMSWSLKGLVNCYLYKLILKYRGTILDAS